MMKWYNQNIKEQLSAYLDDELPKHEKDLLEDKLISSAELRTEFEEDKKVKELLSSLKRLPEDEYFATRLMEKIKGEKKTEGIFSFFKKPVVAFGIVTIFLMGILKFYPNFFPTFLSKQKTNIIDFYTQNLKPFVYVADLNSEDIFNFAFNNNLPLNKEDRQMLQLLRDSSGNQFVEVTYAGSAANAYNLPAFVKSLKLTNDQKQAVDSILLSYSDDISSHILVNEKNTVAVNPSIWNYHNAIRSDLLSYVASVNKEVSDKIMPAAFVENNIASLHRIQQQNGPDEDTYFVFSPDTIFTQKLHLNKDELKDEIHKFKKEMSQHTAELNKIKRFKIDVKVFPDEFTSSQKMKVMIDSNICRVQIPQDIAMENYLPDFDSLNSILDIAFDQLRNFQFDIRVESPEKEETAVYNDKKRRKTTKKFEFNIGNEGFSIPNPDSLATFFRFYFQDSTKTFKFNDKMNEDMEVFKKEMERFKNDMEKMKKELQKELKKNSEKKDPIEI
ncbi:MAG: hypothetical protein M0P61_08060 [Ignavibacteriaceae bacterium]|nr:hypothetical protein [Ignavibacteriaceae bacterium]